MIGKIARLASVGRAMAGLLLVLGLTGCASVYVDNQVPEIPASQYRKPETAHPVQVMFQFETKGVANLHATAHLKARVIEQIRASGLFSAVSEEAAADAASLSLILNNVSIDDNAFAKGALTGLTFGLAGSQVGDGYVCTATYRAPAAATPIVRTARHAIYTTLGAKSGPAGATQAANLDDAVTRMTRQVVSTVLNDVTQDPSFK